MIDQRYKVRLIFVIELLLLNLNDLQKILLSNFHQFKDPMKELMVNTLRQKGIREWRVFLINLNWGGIYNVIIGNSCIMLLQEKIQEHTYLGPYLIIGKIEEGTQSNVLLGKNNDKFYGLKVYKNGHKGMCSLEKEAEILCYIDDDSIIKPLEIYGFHSYGCSSMTEPTVQPFIVMQYYQNGDLRHFINSGSIPLRVKNTLIRNMAKCLLATELKGIIHRDIKPENFLVGSNYNLKLIDFGVAMKEGEKKQDLVGTLNYIAPEIHKSKSYSYKSDIFALGVILFQLLIDGRVRFPFKEAKLTDNNFLLLKQKMYGRFWVKYPQQSIQQQIKIILQRLLSPNPEERPTASQILEMDLFKNEASKLEIVQFFERSKPASKIQHHRNCNTF